MRYFIEFAYRGTHYHGSQTQPNGVTVQEVMEQTFSLIMRRPVPLTFAGRTDAGVHAEMMMAHFDTDTAIEDIQGLVKRLNGLLPDDIAIRSIRRVTDDAHARFSPLERTYEYRITDRKDPFHTDLKTCLAYVLDIEQMNRAAAQLLGTHDFASFCRTHTDVKTTFCTVTHAEFTRINEHELVFTISADRFLRNMVRAVVGTLLDVGRGKMSYDTWSQILAQKNRCSAGQSAPAEGLFLTKITYNQSIYL